MDSEKNLLLNTLNGSRATQTPFWFMRQAGRYLPEYKEVRRIAGSFLDFCYNPVLASKVTLQPISKFSMNAAIIFSDILVVPHALGVDVTFTEGFGPSLKQKNNIELKSDDFSAFLKPVYQSINKTRQELKNDTALIGFAGAPFTLAAYMTDGDSKNGFAKTLQSIRENRSEFTNLINILSEAVALHLINQLKAGADTLQIFDSWAGILDNDADFEDFIIRPTAKISATVKREYPDAKIIGFPRQAKNNYISYAAKSGVDAVSFDQEAKPEWIARNIPDNIVVQGNLDNVLLRDNLKEALNATRYILETFKGRPHIFNLGHGMLPETPVEHVLVLSDFIRGF